MTALIAAWWAAIWPNLVASVLWAAPAFTVHHKLLKRHITRTVGSRDEHGAGTSS